jgi:hypothetical protein
MPIDQSNGYPIQTKSFFESTFKYPILFYNYCKRITYKNILLRQQSTYVNLLNNIEDEEIRDDLSKLFLNEIDYYKKCNIISKYNNHEYLSDININKIISFAMELNETNHRHKVFEFSNKNKDI